jgi:hypothetical protein
MSHSIVWTVSLLVLCAWTSASAAWAQVAVDTATFRLGQAVGAYMLEYRFSGVGWSLDPDYALWPVPPSWAPLAEMKPSH